MRSLRRKAWIAVFIGCAVFWAALLFFIWVLWRNITG
ncbi:YmiA family putative membrane protein [Serratia sp. JUb9]|uniref:YmiA family putative membrane protein n=1 Tax=Serratia rhizosphaerae TaxID=2597702 RepID=A0ABX6GPH1_9GAMM|nr:YmiA family putative membrane protein [Serratia rhizosphaerae]MBU3894470.1 YmiA family putative membrane protein [Serratia rubidaea]QHA88188.1 YmiA family putative membrane protein [Serratia rhizosphaerae]QNK33413.1 YmiA family putative membrane protein [Serratia sp. JUb9]